MLSGKMRKEVERYAMAYELGKLPKGKLVDMVIALREELAEKSAKPDAEKGARA